MLCHPHTPYSMFLEFLIRNCKFVTQVPNTSEFLIKALQIYLENIYIFPPQISIHIYTVCFQNFVTERSLFLFKIPFLTQRPICYVIFASLNAYIQNRGGGLYHFNYAGPYFYPSHENQISLKLLHLLYNPVYNSMMDIAFHLFLYLDVTRITVRIDSVILVKSKALICQYPLPRLYVVTTLPIIILSNMDGIYLVLFLFCAFII